MKSPVNDKESLAAKYHVMSESTIHEICHKVSFNMDCEVFLIYHALDDCILCNEPDRNR